MLLHQDPLSGLLALAPSPAVRGLHGRQIAATRGIHRFRSWLAGRRSGKSYAAAVWLLGGKKGEISVYCARTLKSAKGIMLAVFVELNEKYGLGLDIRASTGIITEPNGHVIQLFGLHDQSAADLMRGLSRLRRVFVDEGGAFTDELLKYSVESVLQPMLLDLQGSMCIAGTPGSIPKGYFYDITGNPGLTKPVVGRWKTSHWTYEQNPHVPASLVLSEALAANGWTPEHATFKREYGAIWCEDAEALVYRYKTLFDANGKPLWSKPPSAGQTVMAIDFGVVDRTSFVVGRQAYDQRPHVHVVAAFAKSNMGLPEIAAKAREYRERFSVNKIYADEGALGKGYANHLRDQYRLPIEKAEKLHKRSRIDAVRGRIDSETLHLCEEASPLYDEWLSLCWNDTRDDHHPRMLDDLSDATCYLLACPEFSAFEFPITPTVPVDPRVAMKERASQRAMAGAGMGRFGGI